MHKQENLSFRMEEKFKLELKNSTEEYNRREVETVQYGSRATRRGERGLGRLMEVLSKTVLSV